MLHPKSTVDKINETPLGTYAYPLSEKIFEMLVKDKMRDFGDKYIHLFKIPEQGMLYLGEGKSDITDIQIIKFIRTLNKDLSIEQAKAFINHPQYKNDSKNDFLYELIKDVNFQVEVGVFNTKKGTIGTGMYNQRGLRVNHPKIAKALLSIGVNGFVDLGHKIIFNTGPNSSNAESQQLVIINPTLAQNSFIRSFDYKSLLSHTATFSRTKSVMKVDDEYVKRFVEMLGEQEAFRRIWNNTAENGKKIPEDSWIWKIYHPEEQDETINHSVFLNLDTPLFIKRKQYLRLRDFLVARVIVRDDPESLHNIPLIKAIIKDNPYSFKRFMESMANEMYYEQNQTFGRLEDYKDLIKELLNIDDIYDYYTPIAGRYSSKFENLLDNFSAEDSKLIQNIFREIRDERGDSTLSPH